jgi:hypothetical protein
MFSPELASRVGAAHLSERSHLFDKGWLELYGAATERFSWWLSSGKPELLLIDSYDANGKPGILALVVSAASVVARVDV